LKSIVTAFNQLKEDIRVALLTQEGNIPALEQNAHACKRLWSQIEEHTAIIPLPQKEVLARSIPSMIQALDLAKRPRDDFPDVQPMEVKTLEYTGQRGHSRIVLNPEVLEATHHHQGPTELGRLFNVSSRTVRRCLVDAGLEKPGQPVYVDFVRETESGLEVRRLYLGSSRSMKGSYLLDEDLDDIMGNILESFPNIGRRMIDGQLRFLGHHIPCSRLQQSYARIVVHGFIDGYLRFITAIRAANNNNAETVCRLFQEGVSANGLPSHV
ncbi:hypothetical protein DFP72DRAFT_774876, partial [Ephemerocybe angulata]